MVRIEKRICSFVICEKLQLGNFCFEIHRPFVKNWTFLQSRIETLLKRKVEVDETHQSSLHRQIGQQFGSIEFYDSGWQKEV